MLRITLSANGSLYCCSDGVRGRGAAVKYLSHNASFHSKEKIAPSNRGIKQLGLQPNDPRTVAAGWEICLITSDVAKAYDQAISKGCSPVAPPTEKLWGQTVSYLRDLNGCLVELASPIRDRT